MNNDNLNDIFRNVQKTHFPGKLRRVRAQFYPYRSLRHSVEWNGLTIKAKVSQLFIDAPVNILEIIALLLLSRVYKKKIDAQTRHTYRTFSNQLTYKRSTRKIDYDPIGKHFDLRDIFDHLNNIYFSNELAIKYIGWSKNYSYTRLGFFDKSRNLIVISKIFDSPHVPMNVLEYLMFHEMLHVKFPEETINNRRRIHTPEFRKVERDFPEYKEIDLWLKNNLRKLVRNSG